MSDSIKERNILVLFDVDGTLTKPRLHIKPDMIEFLSQLSQKVTIAIVGGSDLAKIEEQVGSDVIKSFTYVFSENGLVAFKNGDLIAQENLAHAIGETQLKRIVNWTLKYIAELDIPIKRGTFIEYRNAMLNVSPIGRNCSQEERLAFSAFDEKEGIREQMVKELQSQFEDLNLKYSIGGQISIDVFPEGWDKTYCLRFVRDAFDEIHFFGDKVYEGGNDFEIYTSNETIGHPVTGPHDTMEQCKSLFLQ